MSEKNESKGESKALATVGGAAGLEIKAAMVTAAREAVDAILAHRLTLAVDEIKALHLDSAKRVLRSVYRQAAVDRGYLPDPSKR